MHVIETVGVFTFGTKHSNGTRFALEDEHNDRLGHQQRENKMNDWFKGLSKSQALGWIGICLLATAIVLVFVRRLLGTDIVL
jgi:hypothetical protein